MSDAEGTVRGCVNVTVESEVCERARRDLIERLSTEKQDIRVDSFKCSASFCSDTECCNGSREGRSVSFVFIAGVFLNLFVITEIG